MKCYSNPIPEHDEVPVADGNQLEDRIDCWERRETRFTGEISKSNKSYVVSFLNDNGYSNQLDEILSLVRTQGGRIVGHDLVSLDHFNPRTLLGSGKIKEIASRALDAEAGLLVIDAELSPSQLRNVEDVAGMAVCDRESVILNVFMNHARTRKAKIQVEIAHLEYLRPRIRGLGLDMDQQASSLFKGRGPGETASAMLARKLDRRLDELKKALSKISKTSAIQRNGRSGSQQVSLVGYTNAGKTSLMNALTGEMLSAKNKPFETLDTTTRCLASHGGDVLISDTVGFIRRLPDRLFASFESTLDIIKDSNLLVVVVDMSDAEMDLHVNTTLKVLKSLRAAEIPMLFVFNKSDCLAHGPSNDELTRICRGNTFICVSSRNNQDIRRLKAAILEKARMVQHSETVHIPYEAKDVFTLIYSKCRVIQSEAKQDGMRLVVEGPPGLVAKVKSRINEVYHG